MTALTTISAGTGAIPDINDNFIATSPAGMYGRRASATSGLTWGYYGGIAFGNTIANGTVALTGSTTNYVVASRSTGAVSSATTTTNWNNQTDYCRLYQIVTGSASVSSYTDYRDFLGGGSSGGGGTDRSTVTALSISTGVVNIDCSLGDYFTLALTANVTSITFSNLPGSGKGASLMFRITQDSTARTVTWPASFRWEGGAPSVSTGSGEVDLLAITTFDNGTTWDATLSKGRA